MNGLISQTLDWITHPSHAKDTSLSEWAAGLALVLIIAFLWHKVISQIE